VVSGAEYSAPIPKSVDLALFRIVQESLHNASKHSHANRVDIVLKEENGHLKLDLRDNGVGFDQSHADSPATEPGWGLSIMRERAEAAGAGFTVESSLGQGVR